MSKQDWQIRQGASCGCKGHDELCKCQNVNAEDELTVTFPKGKMTAPDGQVYEVSDVKITFTKDRR